jgi:Na+/melibiose symporter-like transporter
MGSYYVLKQCIELIHGVCRSLVNCITSNQSSQVSLNSCRNAFAMVRCVVYDVTDVLDTFR